MSHKPVLLETAIESLNITPEGIYVDCTLGGGGHTKLICQYLDSGKVICIDRDYKACQEAQKVLDPLKVRIYHNQFSNIDKICTSYEQKINGILMDLGTSAMQLGQPDRGFSFMKEGPLDMRMDLNQEQTALKVIQQANVKQLSQIFLRLGNERHHLKLAKVIKEHIKNIATTLDLSGLILKTVGWHEKNQHPATRIFQALRIYVNQELEELNLCLHKSFDLLALGGRLSVISFHYLEDRIVKQFMASKVKTNDAQPLSARWVTRHSIPSETEVKLNKRSRSAIFRCLEKLF